MRTATVALAAAAVPLLLSPLAAAQTTAEPVVTRERGYAITCSGSVGRSSVTAELYTNTTVRVPASVVVETPRAVLVPVEGGAPPRIRKGTIAAKVRLEDRDTRERAGSATVAGTYRRTGPVTQVKEEFTDAGHRIQVTGTNQGLRVALWLIYGHRSARLGCTNAFAFDLTVVKTPL